jgi:hypothetical protein
MYPSLELLGRRMTVIISDTIFIIGAILCTVPTHQVGLIYAGRFFTGMGVGGIAAVSPIYIAEISPPAIRGRLTGFFESFYQTGAVIGFWINYGIVHNMDRSKSLAWRLPMGVQLIPAGLLMMMIPFLKESPTWLLKRGRKADALKVYSFFRNLPEDHEYIAQDVAFVEREIAKERAALVGDEKHASFGQIIKAAAKEAAQPGMRNRFLLVFLMFMWQAWSGAAAINYYSPTIFTSIGLSDVTLWTGVYGIIKAGGSIIFFTWFIDMFGRKWPWIISSLICAFCQYYLAIYINLGKPKVGAVMSESTIAGGKGATAMIMIFGAAWSFGVRIPSPQPHNPKKPPTNKHKTGQRSPLDHLRGNLPHNHALCLRPLRRRQRVDLDARRDQSSPANVHQHGVGRVRVLRKLSGVRQRVRLLLHPRHQGVARR